MRAGSISIRTANILLHFQADLSEMFVESVRKFKTEN